MLVAFRTDASPGVGAGHLSRCLALADALKERGATSVFIGVCDMTPLHERLIANGYRHFALDPAVSGTGEEDAAATKLAMETVGLPVDWLVVDHYQLGAAWMRQMRSKADRLMVIDDLANRPIDADLLLDQNLVANAERRYVGLLPDACLTLLGTRFALLDRSYASLRGRDLARNVSPTRKVLVAFGGGGHDVTRTAVAALVRLSDANLEVDIVVPADWAGTAAIRPLIQELPNFRLHLSPTTLSSLIANADLALGACGSTSWERLCLGVPSVTLTLADNQRPLASALHDQGLTAWLGDASDVTEESLFEALEAKLSEPRDDRWRDAAMSLVDGKGAQRVADIMTLSPSSAVVVRRASLGDEQLLLRWANDPVTRQRGFDSRPISAETHSAWLNARLGEQSSCRLMIAETEGGYPVGQVRFQQIADGWEVHYGLAPEARGRRLGAKMLAAALESFKSEFCDASITGRVRVENRASCRIFESLGFDQCVVDASTTAYRLRPASSPNMGRSDP